MKWIHEIQYVQTILLHSTQPTAGISNDMHGSQRHHVEQKKQTQKDMMFNCIHMKFKNRHNWSMVTELRILFLAREGSRY